MAHQVPIFSGHEHSFRPKVQLWLSNENNQGFGHGRIELFRLIGRMGSLSKAARAMGMSYRAAWGKIKDMERAIGVRLVCSQGAKRDGYALTPEALALMDAFERWFNDVQEYAAQQANHYFPAQIAPQLVPERESSQSPAIPEAPVPGEIPS